MGEWMSGKYSSHSHLTAHQATEADADAEAQAAAANGIHSKNVGNQRSIICTTISVCRPSPQKRDYGLGLLAFGVWSKVKSPLNPSEA